MKTNICLSTLIGTYVVFTFGSALEAQEQQLSLSSQTNQHPFYVKFDLGGNWTSDLNLEEYFGTSLAPGAKVKLDPGFRAGISGGYQVLPWFGPEVELGYMGNQIESITGAQVDDAFIANMPILLNVRLQLPNKTGFVPYIGGGLGASVSIFDAGRISLNGTDVYGSAADVVFAYQAFAGLRYQINKQISVGAEYRYFFGDSPPWEAVSASGTATDRISFGSAETHAVSFVFEYRF
jgi:opacity protein-like surface antigen